MRLLYCYVQFLNEQGKRSPYRGLDQLEFNFSATDKYSYDASTSTLRRMDRKSPLPEHFWSVAGAQSAGDKNIYNVNVISGENGSGKTTAMHYLIDLLDGLYAAVEPQVSDHDRMEKLGVAKNLALLLLENDGEQYLLHYVPRAHEDHRLNLDGFPAGMPQVFTCWSWQDLSEARNVTGEKIASLLLHTKVIYETNTLNQRDYERHVGSRNERLRDYFVYDASIGSTIGPDIAQFFPYEVYKQIKYVFDKKQADKRAALEGVNEVLRLPNALRIHLRVDVA